MNELNQKMRLTQNFLPKILFVDDKQENLIALEVLLKDVKAELFRANSGNEAIALTLDHDFALVLLDVQMPEMDGFEVAEILHNNAKTEFLPIIFVSAIYSGDFYKVKGVEAGAIDFIEKPINPKLLLGKVRLFLELYNYRKQIVEDSFLSVVGEVSDGVMIVNHDRTILLVNSTAESQLGIEAQNLIGTPFDYPLTPGELNELTFTRNDGQKRHVELNVSTTNWQGQPAFVVSIRDVTERILNQSFLESMITDLNAKNAELESFNYTVSHDLKSPLITICGLADLLQKTLGHNATEDVRSFVEGISGAAKKMSLLLEHLLTLSRIGQSDTFLTKHSLREVVATVAEEMSLQIKQNKIDLVIADNLPNVMGEMVSLTQMMQNLIDNAIKYMGEQLSPVIEIGVVETDTKKIMFVRDNGCGIDPAYIKNIFGLFKRLSAETKGAGVGLAIVKKIVTFHGGEIWAESAGEGKGTTFWIQMPFE